MFQIRIHLIRIRIQHLKIKNWLKLTAEFFFISNHNLPIPRPPERTSRLQKKPISNRFWLLTVSVCYCSWWAGGGAPHLPRRQPHEPRQASRQHGPDPRRRESTLQGFLSHFLSIIKHKCSGSSFLYLIWYRSSSRLILECILDDWFPSAQVEPFGNGLLSLVPLVCDVPSWLVCCLGRVASPYISCSSPWSS